MARPDVHLRGRLLRRSNVLLAMATRIPAIASEGRTDGIIGWPHPERGNPPLNLISRYLEDHQ